MKLIYLNHVVFNTVVYSCCMQFPKQLMKKPLYPGEFLGYYDDMNYYSTNQLIEFEAHYWQHQQHIKKMRKKEAQRLVRNLFNLLSVLFGLYNLEKFTKGKCCCTAAKCS